MIVTDKSSGYMEGCERIQGDWGVICCKLICKGQNLKSAFQMRLETEHTERKTCWGGFHQPSV